MNDGPEKFRSGGRLNSYNICLLHLADELDLLPWYTLDRCDLWYFVRVNQRKLYMAGFKKLITGLVIGLIVGMWMGVNIGKDQPLWAYPFAEEQKILTDKAKETANTATKDVKKALREKLEEPEEQK